MKMFTAAILLMVLVGLTGCERKPSHEITFKGPDGRTAAIRLK